MNESSPTRKWPINRILGTLVLIALATIGALSWRAYEKSFEYEIDVCTGDLTVRGAVIQLEKAERDLIIQAARRTGLRCKTVTRTLKRDEREHARMLSRFRNAAAWIAYDRELGDFLLREITQHLHQPDYFGANYSTEVNWMLSCPRVSVARAPDRIDLSDPTLKAGVENIKRRIGTP